MEAAHQLAKHMAGSRCWGLLPLAEGPEDPNGLPPNVLVLKIDAIAPDGEESFDEIVRDLRNRRVHGGYLLVAAIDQAQVQAFVQAGTNADTTAAQGKAPRI